MSKQAVQSIGISVENGKYHLRSSANTKIGVWLEPGTASFKMIKLPHEMTKLEAIQYLKEQKEFKNKKIQAFLTQLQDRRNGMTAPRSYRSVNKQVRQMVEEMLKERLGATPKKKKAKVGKKEATPREAPQKTPEMKQEAVA
ncbi:MAG TPA: hypothetical protein VEP90_10255 [Methylomirabilota bacterium]|nr:hypothetical protein [Methylomirabilota bacterium]